MAPNIAAYFARLPELGFVPVPRFREYGPLADDPDRLDLNYELDAPRGLAFGIEYCDSRGWMSTRTIRCEAVSRERPGFIWAHCNVRRTERTFRLDRIISITHLRTGRILDGASHDHMIELVGGVLSSGTTAPSVFRGSDRDGAALLLAIAGSCSPAVRCLVTEYVIAEQIALGHDLVPRQAVQLWVDHFVPRKDLVMTAARKLAENRESMIRLLPWTIRVVRADGGTDPEKEVLVRELIEAVRRQFAPAPTASPIFARR